MKSEDLILTIEDLIVGDVLIYRPLEPRLHQKVITKTTNSPYTHASIYIGNGDVAEYTTSGFNVEKVDDALNEAGCIIVKRSQFGFGNIRRTLLTQLVQELNQKNTSYNWRGVIDFLLKNVPNKSLNSIRARYGSVISKNQMVTGSRYFCSEFVAIFHFYVEIVGDSAQCVFPTGMYSPRKVLEEVHFGWILGYLLAEGASLPDGEPSESRIHWCAISDDSLKWWL